MLFSMLMLIPRWLRHNWFLPLGTTSMVSSMVLLYALIGIMERRHSEWVIAAVVGWLVFSSFLISLSFIIEIGMDLLRHFRSAKWHELGLRYALEAKGDGCDSHAVKAAKYFMKNALLFDNTAIVNLGLCYAYGFGVEKDPRKAAKCYRVAAGEGDSHAKLALGLCYADGIGIERDKIKAEDLFSKALCYYAIPNIFWNPKEVLMWLREAGERGNASVQMSLGNYYMDGKDYSEAVKWFRKAAEIEYDYSALHDSSFRGRKKRDEALVKLFIKASTYMQLAKIYLCGGNGVGKDEVEAVRCFKKVAELESIDFAISNKHVGLSWGLGKCYLESQMELGRCYLTGTGVEKNEVEAVKWFRKAADRGNDGGQVLLGVCYFNGLGVETDETEAIKWFHRAAKQDGYFAEVAQLYLKAIEYGDPEAQFWLASDYEYGWRFGKNEAEAVKWYRKAAEQGNADAQAALGNCYRYGNGVAKDENEAVKWFRKAAEQGNTDGQSALGECYCAGTGVEKNEVEAVQLFRKAAEQGNADAQAALGNCYRDGIGVAKDENEAVKWLNKAISQGHAGARESLEKIDANSNQ